MEFIAVIAVWLLISRLLCLQDLLALLSVREFGAHYWLLFAFIASCTAVMLIILLCCAWEHFDNRHSDGPGLADNQSIAAMLDRLEFQCELKSKGLSPVDESTWSSTLQSTCGCR